MHGGPDIDWWLQYNVSLQQYAIYEERTFSRAYDEMSGNGEQSIIGYTGGVIHDSFIKKTSPMPDYGEMHMCFDAYGKLTNNTYIWKAFPAFETFHYDPETGLFDGKEIGELGLKFEEADLQVPAPAALDPAE